MSFFFHLGSLAAAVAAQLDSGSRQRLDMQATPHVTPIMHQATEPRAKRALSCGLVPGNCQERSQPLLKKLRRRCAGKAASLTAARAVRPMLPWVTSHQLRPRPRVEFRSLDPARKSARRATSLVETPSNHFHWLGLRLPADAGWDRPHRPRSFQKH